MNAKENAATITHHAYKSRFTTIASMMTGNIPPPAVVAVRNAEPVFVYEPRPRRHIAMAVGWTAD
jgi:hypothetical protein